VERRIHESVLPVQAAIGRAEQECLVPVPRGMIADGEPETPTKPESEAHVHVVDENHEDAKFVFTSIRKMRRRAKPGGSQRRVLRYDPQLVDSLWGKAAVIANDQRAQRPVGLEITVWPGVVHADLRPGCYSRW